MQTAFPAYEPHIRFPDSTSRQEKIQFSPRENRINTEGIAMHRNSQKRYYIPGATYFITTVTRGRYPYFEDDILRDVIIHNLYLCMYLKKFMINGYAIMPDHVHVLIRPKGGFSHSEIMHNLKRVTSLHINQIMFGIPQCDIRRGADIHGPWRGSPDESAEIYPRLRAKCPAPPYARIAPLPGTLHRLQSYRNEFNKSRPAQCPHPPFRWHKSFHDHIIRDERDLRNHIRYIARQREKHGVPGCVWVADV